MLGDLSGIGTDAPGARLDVRAQGALATDVAFRVRNSANTNNIFEVRGDGDIQDGAGYFKWDSSLRKFSINNGSLDVIGALKVTSHINLGSGVSDSRIYSTQAPLTDGFSMNTYYSRMSFGAQNTSGRGTSASNLIGLFNGTAPSADVTDSCAIYSADNVGGDACPHIRTEAGDIIKLYKFISSDLGNTINSGDTATDDAIRALIDLVGTLGLGAPS